MAEINYLQAINQALDEEMERDSSVFLLGEDIGHYGGAFKVTKGLFEKYGETRVIDTPISESAIVGAAIGAAITGMRPVAEIQFADFITCAFNQIVSNAATMHYRFEIPVPLVIRAPSGGKIHGGPFHSKNPEAWFTHQPGLKVVAPSSVKDAKGLLKSAIRDDNPVLYFEHKYLYRRIKGERPDENSLIPLGEASVIREGQDITLVTYGSMVFECIQAAETIEKEEEIKAEIIDLRSLQPMDMETIYKSLEKTSRILVVHEDNLTGGIGAEIAARINENAFHLLDAPVKRVAAMDTPTPFSPILEDACLPNADDIKNAIIQVLTF